jgi:hypothetical protein
VKLVTSLAAALLLCTGAAFAADLGNVVDRDALQTMKDAQEFGIPNPQPQVGGEDIATAANIPVLPYSDGGNTCAYLHDYDESCPYTGSLSPDVVYKYSPTVYTEVDIALCNSLYDTKVFVYENSAGTLVACNDDACGSDGFKSELSCVPMTAGNTYYIVIDGYGSDCGDYSLDVSECVPCIVDCPAGSYDEGEGDCYTDYNDQYNGGCNSVPPVFTPAPCEPDGEVTICGLGGGFTYQGLDYRDTDWYSITADQNPGGITACLTMEYSAFFAVLLQDCANITIVDSISVPECSTTCLAIPAGGAYWVFVGVDAFGPAVGCGKDYTLDLSGSICGPTSVEPASWGEIKDLYR